MKDVLYLVHRIPYPPNKGDKIRSYHLLKDLASRYRVHLGAFVDDADDWQHQQALDPYCASRFLLPLNPRSAKLRSLSGFLTGKALSERYFYSTKMRDWIRATIKRIQPHRVVVYSSVMAQYLLQEEGVPPAIVDFVDVDSDKWLQYSDKASFPMSWVYRRESKTLLEFERRVARYSLGSVFVSAHEADLFRRLAPESSGLIDFYSNGVDIEYFNPAQHFDNPFSGEGLTLVFTGAMDYWANVDAVTWFVDNVFTRLRKSFSQAQFWIVGARPTAAVLSLAELDGVFVTGTVDDVRPYVAHATLAVAPLQLARGVQNKVLEAMAMAKPVIVSSAALAGIDAVPGQDLLVADEPESWLETIRDCINTEGAMDSLAQSGYRCVHNNYTWERALARLEPLFDDASAA